jgi:hypothetical protein
MIRVYLGHAPSAQVARHQDLRGHMARNRLEQATAAGQEYAEDVTDLREAQRIIAELRRASVQPSELTYFADGEFTIFLDDEHANMVLALFEQQRLVARQDPACELHDALSDFVSHWLDVQSNMPRLEQERSRGRSRRITSSA